MSDKVSIYFLIDPRKPEVVRYVGQSATPQTRLIQHCCEAGKSSKCAWLETMRAEGVLPQMVILESVDSAEANHAELIWIKRFGLNGQLSNFQGNSQVQHKRGRSPRFPAPKPAAEALRGLGRVERDMIVDTLRQCGGNKLESSKRLGIGRQTLYNKIKAYNITENFYEEKTEPRSIDAADSSTESGPAV